MKHMIEYQSKQSSPLQIRKSILLLMILAMGFGQLVKVGGADDGLDRLLKKANMAPAQPSSPNQTVDVPGKAHEIAHQVSDSRAAQPASHTQDFHVTEPSGFSSRGELCPVPSQVLPAPLAYGKTIYDPHREYNPWNPDARQDEYVFDGGDKGSRVMVDQSWNVHGLDLEDTIGHFDTLDGRRLVTPSNPVAIYAPRFAAVRKVDGLINAESRVRVGEMEERTLIARSAFADKSTTTKQHVALDRYEGSDRASGLINRNRGVLQESVTHLFGIRNRFEAFENLSLIRFGKFQKSESARLGLGMQSANVWQDDLGLQVAVDNAQPIIVNDVYRVQQLVSVESDDEAAILRVTKVASKISARPGEHVDFTIRFDNLSGRKIGNVTIIDNLVGRLEYVADSAECSLNADFVPSVNESGSLMLRWEITDPLPANKGGLIRFRCRVR